MLPLDARQGEFHFAGAPRAALFRFEALRRNVQATDPSWFNIPANYMAATGEAIQAQSLTFEALRASPLWAQQQAVRSVDARRRSSTALSDAASTLGAREEAGQVGDRMQRVAELCARLGQHETAIDLLQMSLDERRSLVRRNKRQAVPGEPITRRESVRRSMREGTAAPPSALLQVGLELLTAGIEPPWSTTLAIIVARLNARELAAFGARVARDVKAAPDPFDVGMPVLAYHPNYKWLPGIILSDDMDARPAGKAAELMGATSSALPKPRLSVAKSSGQVGWEMVEVLQVRIQTSKGDQTCELLRHQVCATTLICRDLAGSPASGGSTRSAARIACSCASSDLARCLQVLHEALSGLGPLLRELASTGRDRAVQELLRAKVSPSDRGSLILAAAISRLLSRGWLAEILLTSRCCPSVLR